jgi:hypothetical protein
VWLLVALLLALCPLVAVKYFFTNDGPSHTYNGHVLIDMLSGKGVEFYRQFYTLTLSMDNLADHLVLGLLQIIFEPYMAEKLVQMGYVGLFVFACYRFIGFFNKRSGILLLCMLPLVYPWSFAEGFYNYSFSLALMIYAMYRFCLYATTRTAYNWLWVSGILILLYFCHPVGLVLALIAYAIILLIYSYSRAATWIDTKLLAVRILSDVATIVLPIGLFIYKLIYNPNKTEFAIEYKPSLWTHFFENTGMVVLGDIERPFTEALGLMTFVIVIVLLVDMLIKKEARAYHFLLAMAVVSFIIFLIVPDAAMGGWMLKPRFRYVPYLFLTLWICIAGRGKLAPLITTGFLFIFFSLMAVRMPLYARASHIFEQQEKAFGYIANKSVVLPVNFNKNSLALNDSVLKSECALHYHAFQYAGCKGQKIVCDNYEAIMNYFPLSWVPDKDPYWHTGEYGNVEFQPQSLNIAYYEIRSGSRIDYVLYANEYNYKGTPFVKHQIDTLFDLVYEDKAAFIKLYKRNQRVAGAY